MLNMWKNLWKLCRRSTYWIYHLGTSSCISYALCLI